MYNEIEGNLITLAQSGAFSVIAHGCNCLCRMGAGIAPQMAKAFGCDKFPLESKKYEGDINKLGQIDWQQYANLQYPNFLAVVNAYTQYHYGARLKPFDYEAFTLCMRKMNFVFEGKHIGLPQIGAGLAGGDWVVIKSIITRELKDCDVTVVIYKP